MFKTLFIGAAAPKSSELHERLKTVIKDPSFIEEASKTYDSIQLRKEEHFGNLIGTVNHEAEKAGTKKMDSILLHACPTDISKRTQSSEYQSNLEALRNFSLPYFKNSSGKIVILDAAENAKKPSPKQKLFAIEAIDEKTKKLPFLSFKNLDSLKEGLSSVIRWLSSSSDH